MKSLTLAVLALLALPMSTWAGEKATEARIKEVAERGRHVMPFNLEQTTHIFKKVPTGGIQQVIVKDKANTVQIKLIREHLSKIAREFKAGNFSDPVKIHGKNMPGLEKLRNAKSGEYKVTYKELANGAEIDYVSKKPELVTAIHQFFDAQLSDHARHATSGHDMSGHSMHHSMHGMSGASAQTPKADAVDQRLLIQFDEVQRAYFLKDMRTLFSGTQAILGALANEDMQTVAKTARSLGLGMTHDVKSKYHGAIPKAMMHMGMAMHRTFDDIARDAESIRDSKHTLQQLSSTMAQCSACHASYQIQVNQ